MSQHRNGHKTFDSAFPLSQRVFSQDPVAQIEHFFISYNEMKGKRFEVKRRAGSKRARTLVMAAMKRRR